MSIFMSFNLSMTNLLQLQVAHQHPGPQVLLWHPKVEKTEDQLIIQVKKCTIHCTLPLISGQRRHPGSIHISLAGETQFYWHQQLLLLDCPPVPRRPSGLGACSSHFHPLLPAPWSDYPSSRPPLSVLRWQHSSFTNSITLTAKDFHLFIETTSIIKNMIKKSFATVCLRWLEANIFSNPSLQPVFQL